MPGKTDPKAAFDAILAGLLAATGASRVTLRLDQPSLGFDVNDVVAEARVSGVRTLKSETSIDQRSAATTRWIARERRNLLQNDIATSDLRPPAKLAEIYGVRAQMLGPLFRGDALIGWISVHENTGPRGWRRADAAALDRALAEVQSALDAAG